MAYQDHEVVSTRILSLTAIPYARMLRFMANLNIYIPDDLKARIDAVGTGVNWSEAVRPAIKATLTVHEQRRNQNMTTAIERLRASKEEDAQTDRTEGHAAGRKWAETDASYKELKRLSDQDALDGMDALKEAVDPNDHLTNDELLEFAFGGTEEPSEEYVEAFVQGARKFFAEVQDKI
jgi:hypothetical protein